MKLEWLQFVFLCLVLVLIPGPVTKLQWAAFVVAVVLLVLMALVLWGVLR